MVLPAVSTAVTLNDNLNVMPCFSNRRCVCRRTSPSMPGKTPSKNSTKVTFDPSRRQTEPSSRPMTPAPTTMRCFGTSGSDSAPVDDTIRFSSISIPRSLATSEPVAIAIALASSVCVLPPSPCTPTLPADPAGRGDARGAMKRVDLVLLQQEVDALHVTIDALVLERHHGLKIELRRTDADTHLGKRMPRLLEQFGGMQQRFGWDAADVQARPAERTR